MPASPSTARVGSPGAPLTILMLHGIYGRGRNWQFIAKRLVERRSDVQCLLVDLPHHGGSPPGAHGDTVAGVATDISAWLSREGLAPGAVLGHSFSGKVALEVAARTGTRPMQVWLVDSTPETRPPSGSAWRMLESVRSLPPRFADREEAVAALGAGGWSPHVAQWMASNLVRRGSAFEWQLDFDVMETLLRDFFDADLWPVVEDRSLPHVFHLIKATDSRVVSDEALKRLRAIGPPRVVVHELEGSHWIHAEKPAEVVELLARELPAGR